LAFITVISNAAAAAITLGSNNSWSLSISAMKAVWILVGGRLWAGGPIDHSILRVGEFISRFLHFLLPSWPSHFAIQFCVYGLMADSIYIGPVE
jgi:hypothetical protein